MPLNFTAVPLVPSDYTELALGVICRLHCPFWTKQLHNTVLAHSSLCVRAFAGPVPSASSGAQKRGETCARRRCGRWRSAEVAVSGGPATAGGPVRAGRGLSPAPLRRRPSHISHRRVAVHHAVFSCLLTCRPLPGASLKQRQALLSELSEGSRLAEVMLLPPAAL